MCNICITGEGGSSIKCYSALLSNMSPLLKVLLQENNSSQLILPDIPIKDIVNVMNLIYTGE